eukprot:CAMPEP_0119475476 /NCGR_PEP_ID=MMETSP1344-20130328/6348_1 /TAXON_ID=236787 /ORGANISM="Florenciella parvula, Strain CCMP2471" /LENGTH=110 /DNA_ID=CAMNT_0007509013 /DNA_START=814 /DNA_END=1142 /DNA_ORIENTATION=+
MPIQPPQTSHNVLPMKDPGVLPTYVKMKEKASDTARYPTMQNATVPIIRSYTEYVKHRARSGKHKAALVRQAGKPGPARVCTCSSTPSSTPVCPPASPAQPCASRFLPGA